MPCLFILVGPGAGNSLPLVNARTVLGRLETCDIQLKLPDPERQKTISAKHAVISCDQGKYHLQDGDGDGNRSHDGTILNDHHVPQKQQGRLINDPSGEFPDSSNILGLALRSVLCTSLVTQQGKAFGVLLMDGQIAKRKLSPVDLNFLMGVASQASIALLLDPQTLPLVNAGHPSPLLRRRATGALEEAIPGDVIGPAIGVLDDFPFEAHQVALEPGDDLILFSDGVTDAMDVHEDPLGTDRLRTAFQAGGATPDKRGEGVLQAVKKHAAGHSQHDDITMVCLGRVA